jgi:hypothetical protein
VNLNVIKELGRKWGVDDGGGASAAAESEGLGADPLFGICIASLGRLRDSFYCSVRCALCVVRCEAGRLLGEGGC